MKILVIGGTLFFGKDIVELARGYLLALASSKAVNQVYNIAQTRSFRLVEWVELVARSLGVSPNLIHIPADIIQQANCAYAEDWTYTATATFDISKAVTELGFEPTTVESWTAMTAQWYLETRHENDSPGYADRAKEVAFAEQYREKTA